MTFLNDFVTRELDEMRKFLHYISVCGSDNSLKFVFRPWWWSNLPERQRSAAVYTKMGYMQNCYLFNQGLDLCFLGSFSLKCIILIMM